MIAIDIKMPTSCRNCLFRYKTVGCLLDFDIMTKFEQTKPDNCPLIELSDNVTNQIKKESGDL